MTKDGGEGELAEKAQEGGGKSEGEGEGEVEEEEEERREEWEIQRDAYKSAGDAAFRSSDFTAAVREYTAALSVDPNNHVLLSNRSAAYLGGGERSRALADARECVRVSPGEFAPKAHGRLGAAVLSLGRWGEAREAYRTVLKADPKNEAARRGLEQCRKGEERERVMEREALERAERRRIDKEKEEEEAKRRAEEEAKKEDGRGEKGEEDDLLDDFFADVENATAKKTDPSPEEAASDTGKNGTETTELKGNSKDTSGGVESGSGEGGENKIQVQLADLGTSADQLDRLLAPNHEWRNLNPFYVLSVPHTVDDDVLSRRYKALSLLLHPDKCPDPRAAEAFEYVRRAMKHLGDEDKRRHAIQLVEQGIKSGRKSYLDSLGGDDPSDEKAMEDAQSKAVMKLFAEIEMRRRDVEKRKRAQEKREREQEDEEVAKEKREREFDRRWRDEGRVEKRVGNWRDFEGGVGGGGPKKKKSRWGK